LAYLTDIFDRHDFEEFSQGCGGRTPNEAGKHALRAAGRFLNNAPQLHTLSGAPAAGGSYAPVSFISNFSQYPPVTTQECAPGAPQQTQRGPAPQ